MKLVISGCGTNRGRTFAVLYIVGKRFSKSSVMVGPRSYDCSQLRKYNARPRSISWVDVTDVVGMEVNGFLLEISSVRIV
jgi:hypothetical protein